MLFKAKFEELFMTEDEEEEEEEGKGRCILEVFQVARLRYKSRPSAVSPLKCARRNAITRARQMPDARLMKSDGNAVRNDTNGKLLLLTQFSLRSMQEAVP